MPHPFFDAIAFPWHRPEGSALLQALAMAVRDYQPIDLVYRQCSLQLPSIPNSVSSEVMWKHVLDQVTPAGLLRKLCDLLQAAITYTNLRPSIQAVVSAEDPLTSSFIADTHIFLDRTQLRDRLAKLGRPNSTVRGLLVRGAGGSGKSWSRLLVEEVASAYGDGCLYLYEGQVSTVGDVFEQLFAAVGSNAIPEQLESEDAYYRKVCVRLQERAPAQNRRWWVVADDLGAGSDGPRLDPQIRRFFDHFALQLANPALGKWFRLVLLDYPDGALPTKWRREVICEDRPSCTDVDTAVLVDFLDRWGLASGRQLPEDKRKSLAEKVLQEVDQAAADPATASATDPAAAPAACRMQRINDALQATLDALAGGHS